MIDVADAPVITFAITKPQTTSTDSPRFVTVANIGNAPLIFPVPASGTNAYTIGGPTFALDGESTCPMVGVSSVAASLDAGSSCVYGVGFMPEYRGTYPGYVVLTDNDLNVANGQPGSGQGVRLNGTASTSDSTRTTIRINPSTVTAGLGRDDDRHSNGYQYLRYRCPGRSHLHRQCGRPGAFLEWRRGRAS